MVMALQKYSGLPTNKVVGMAGILDTGRFRTFLAEELNVSVNSIDAYVLGGHGDSMVPLLKATTIGGVPVEELIEKNRLEEIDQRTRDGGAEIVAHLKTGSAYFAPASAAAQMVNAIITDSKEILPVCAWMTGEYGISDVYLGITSKIGGNGVEEVIELPLNDEELDQLHGAAESVKKKAVVVESEDNGDSIEIRHMGILSLTWDHRVFDGSTALLFLNAIKDKLENHDWSGEIS
mgnify:CR=1 FL=1